MRVFVSKSIYVGNLPWSATEDQIRKLFSAYGTVNSVNLISDRNTGRARGFGFVEMPDADATAAIQAFNGFRMDGRSLEVNEAQPKVTRSPRY
jgi:RNA-binding proteins (RRM domain)